MRRYTERLKICSICGVMEMLPFLGEELDSSRIERIDRKKARVWGKWVQVGGEIKHCCEVKE